MNELSSESSGSESTKRARTNRVTGIAITAPIGPSTKVQKMSEKKVASRLSPTLSLTKRGWMITCTTTLTTL